MAVQRNSYLAVGLLALELGMLNLSKVKVKVALEQALKAQRGSRGIALLFL
jgi:hypothetical protein